MPPETRKALKNFHQLPPADPRHPYLRSHRHRGDFALQIEGLDIRQEGNRLAVGMHDRKGVIRNIQHIAPDGTKRFLKGCPTRGQFFRIGNADTAKVGLVEGLATGITFNKASELDTYVSFGCRNLAPVASELASKDMQVVVCGDVGQHSEAIAEEVAAAVGGEMYIPRFKDGDRGSDINDYAQRYGLNRSKKDIEKNTVSIPPPPDPLDVMADMSPAEFRKQRTELAAHFGMDLRELESQVKERRQEVRFEETIPWAEPVDGVELADAIYTELHRHVFLSEPASIAVTLWIIFTHLIDKFRIAPMLHAKSPEKRCGKTTLLDFLNRTVARPMMVSNVSTAALFRMIELYQPTSLIDEAETFMKVNEELRGIVNSGHTKSAAYVVRCVGDDNTPRRFCTWGAKAIASIKDMPDTITDRAVVIPMRRKLPDDKRKQLTEPVPGDVLDRLRRKIVRWVQDNGSGLDRQSTRRVAGLNDRAFDNWRPLLQIAKRIGPEWYDDARTAALKLASHDASQGDSRGVQLLQDLRDLFDSADETFLDSTRICRELAKMDDRPWPEFTRHKEAITTTQLARLLKPYGIRPRQKKSRRKDGSQKNCRGYFRRKCEDAFRRYCD